MVIVCSAQVLDFRFPQLLHERIPVSVDRTYLMEKLDIELKTYENAIAQITEGSKAPSYISETHSHREKMRMDARHVNAIPIEQLEP